MYRREKGLCVIVCALMAILTNPWMLRAQETDSLGNNSELSLKDLFNVRITVASKTEENVSDAPGTISVITQDQIKRFGGTTLADVIQRAPSLQFIGSHLFPENVMVMRGDLQTHYDNHILILINGRPFRDDIAGGVCNTTFYQAFPISLIERIEFIRGPGSVLYGTDAFDGVINIMIKKPVKEIEADITAGGGSFSGKLGKATVGFKKEGFNVIANANYFNDDGWDFKATTVYPPAPQNLIGSMKYYKDDLSGSLFLNGKGFSFNAYHATIKHGNLGNNPIWQMGGDGQSWLDEKRTFLDAGYSGKVKKDYTVTANITFNYSIFESHTMKAPSTENSYGTLGEVSFGGPIFKRMNFILGSAAVERWNDLRTGQKIPKANESYYYAYTQIDYAPIEKIKLFTGAQYNKAPNIDGVLVPRIGGIYHVTDEFGAKINYAEAFRSAMPMETRVNFPGVIVGNPALKPEIVKSADFQVFYNLKKVQSALSFFLSKYEDLIVRIPHPSIANTSSYSNAGALDIHGVEVDGKVLITSQLYLEGSATYQKEVDGKVLTPKYLAKGGASYNSPFGLNVGVYNNYYGYPKRNAAGKAANPEAKEVHLISVNVDYSLPFYKPITLNLFIKNALDQDYYYPEFSKKWVNTLPLEPGRAVYGTVSYHF
jgi:outer membrane receptor for ferrienterochelin and colicins